MEWWALVPSLERSSLRCWDIGLGEVLIEAVGIGKRDTFVVAVDVEVDAYCHGVPFDNIGEAMLVGDRPAVRRGEGSFL